MLDLGLEKFAAPYSFIHSTMMYYYVSYTVWVAGSGMMTDVRIIKTIPLNWMIQTYYNHLL